MTTTTSDAASPGEADTAADASPRPLAGVRVLAVENFVAAPFATMWLADAGADVVKIEEPRRGDQARVTGPMRKDADGRSHSLAFLRTNRNKRSVTLDLKHADGKRLFLELAAQADVVLENLRPGVMDQLGLGWPVLSALNPRLIYVAISGFGHRDLKPSPYSDHPAFDIVAQALSGLMQRPERSDDRPVYLGFSLSDIEAGIVAAQGTLLALLQRAQTGRGQKVDISMYDASMVLNEISIAMFSVTRQKAKPGAHAIVAPFGTYRARDGYLVIAVVGEPIFARFCEVIGQPAMIQDPRYASGPSRAEHVAALNAAIEPWLMARTRAEVVETLVAAGVPAAVVNDADDILDCPHVAARDMLVTLDDPVWGPVQVPGNPIKMSGVADMQHAHPPRLGEHTAEVLSDWLGMGAAEVAELGGRHVV